MKNNKRINPVYKMALPKAGHEMNQRVNLINFFN
jgi:hypothetical protein